MVTVLGATSGKVVNWDLSLLRLGEQPHESIAPLVSTTPNILGSLIVDLAGGEDTLAVVGNALSQTFNINDDEVPFTDRSARRLRPDPRAGQHRAGG